MQEEITPGEAMGVRQGLFIARLDNHDIRFETSGVERCTVQMAEKDHGIPRNDGIFPTATKIALPVT